MFRTEDADEETRRTRALADYSDLAMAGRGIPVPRHRSGVALAEQATLCGLRRRDARVPMNTPKIFAVPPGRLRRPSRGSKLCSGRRRRMPATRSIPIVATGRRPDPRDAARNSDGHERRCPVRKSRHRFYRCVAMPIGRVGSIENYRDSIRTAAELEYRPQAEYPRRGSSNRI